MSVPRNTRGANVLAPMLTVRLAAERDRGNKTAGKNEVVATHTAQALRVIDAPEGSWDSRHADR